MRKFGPGVTLDNAAFIHETALVYGNVHIGEGASLWPYVVIRSEMHEVLIGKRTNIQDFVMIHVGNETPTVIGDNCSITHHCTIHGAEIGDACLIGINSTLMDGVKVGRNSIVAGHSIVTEGTVIPENSIVAGAPARVIKTRDNSVANVMNARFYYENALAYRQGDHRVTERKDFRQAMAEEMNLLTTRS
ncbi:gamma carbonic anhydrase family protein [Parvibaculum sp.]|jgi:carbonic anhydrase/acetyltransferase-like protein (isoleucine patch superfamily)|uniref:gamma carbonic anhydrase family protein n=1 Tax=Parvibaculum sp. TaxID=2024848 RepID=UPI001B012C9B|nr:gamma carbonic anhydrase family protein [Parvibaculum sp.]MBO6634939.1 gamma carbonic anhydrase family protein [Parvibaculum sp.]MBO6679147.1 gamma carbonic anhydrase family protein [Parvibaculum sp.]MBO6685666.1 gamma carbonic anhydrase family protein [Parvibaculum sp.]MBO6904152.1 gamma carbonic anhydrase family protein [Parvibaculum sp.]